MNYQTHYFISIADITISVTIVDNNLNLILSPPVESFLCSKNEIANINIRIHYDIPEKFKNNKVLFIANKAIMDSSDYSIYDWSICKSEDINFIKIYKEKDISNPEIIASFDQLAKNWNIYYAKSYLDSNNYKADPFIYPLGPLIIYYIITHHGGLMIHSSGITDKTKGYIFTGLSGTGKTTISKIWNKENVQIINDDRLIIRQNHGVYCIFNTPMNYKDESKRGTLNNIFFIKHSKENGSRKIEGTEAIARLFSNCIQHNYDKQLINSLLTRCSDICQRIPIYELGFIPDSSIVQYIRTNEFN